MSFADLDERPSKKRRFFVDDSLSAATPLKQTRVATTHEDEAGIVEQKHTPVIAQDAPEPQPTIEFDSSLLESIAGEKLQAETIQILRDLSENNIERGRLLVISNEALLTVVKQSTSILMDHGRIMSHVPQLYERQSQKIHFDRFGIRQINQHRMSTKAMTYRHRRKKCGGSLNQCRTNDMLGLLELLDGRHEAAQIF